MNHLAPLLIGKFYNQSSIMLSHMSHHLPSANHFNFIELVPGVGSGNAPNQDWHSIVNEPLVVLVGVTGVGKSTTLQALRDLQLPFTLLPDRRDLTDRLIIAFLQQQDGAESHAVTDRAERFRLTRQYRKQFPGGMGHALSQLLVQNIATSPQEKQWRFFDGLRGANEVETALNLLPRARFIVLDAPDVVRVQRLLGRGDRFDQVSLQSIAAPSPAKEISTTGAAPPLEMQSPTGLTFAAIGVPEADSLFSAEQTTWLLSQCAPPHGAGTIEIDELRTRLKIVAEERRNYDPTAAIQVLQQGAAERTLVIDTTSVDATQAAQQIIQWLDAT